MPKKLTAITGSASQLSGGFFTSVRKLSLETAKRFEVDVISFRDSQTDKDSVAWQPLKLSIHETTFPKRFCFSETFRKELMASEADIIHNHGLWLYPSLLLPIWSGRTRRPYVVSPRGMLDKWALMNSRLIKRLAMVLFERRHLAKAACIHALNESEYKSIRALGFRNPVCIIPNGIDLPPDAPAAEKSGKNLVYVGRIHPKKNLLNLIRAWDMVLHSDNSKMAEWTLTIAGWDQGGHTDELKALAQELGIGRKVEITGPVFGEQKDHLLQTASAFIMPSLSEGLPINVLEAWSRKLPCVLTPHCNLPEGYQANAAIRTSTDATSIKNGILRLAFMSNAERAGMGERGYELVKSRFQWTTIGEKMCQVYDWILNKSGKPGFALD